MKNLKTNLLLLCFLIIGVAAFGQTVQIEEGQTMHNEQLRPSVNMVFQADSKETKKAWEDYMDNTYDINVKGLGLFSNKDVLSAEEVSLPAISDKLINIYASFNSVDENLHMNIMASYGSDTYVGNNNDPQSYTALKNIATSFVKTYLPDAYSRELESAREKLGDLQENLEDMQSDMDKNREEIDDLKKKIAELEAENRDLEQNIASTKRDIEAQQQTVEHKREKLSRVNEELSKY